MSRQIHNSLSTKRRRFLEEIEIIDVYRTSPHPNVSKNNTTVQQQHQGNVSNNIIVDNESQVSNLISDELNFPSLSQCIDDNNISYTVSDSDDTDDEELNHFSFFNDNEDSIIKLITKWAVTYNITNSALSALLKSLKSHRCFSNIPIDARTILKNNNSNLPMEIQSVPPGSYHHFGIAKGIKYLSNYVQLNDESIKILIGIDGLPLTKSSCSVFWPILGCVQLFNSHYVFLIGLYWGYEKPLESNLFLKSFINELKELSMNGIFTNVGQKHIIVNGFCCDAPAKSFILKCKGHNGFYSCTKCTTEGIFFERRVCFPETKFIKRTHLDFLNRVDEEHHMTDKISLITEIPNIDIVNDFPLDYMHLVCLGVAKKLILLWLGHMKNSPLSVRLQNIKIQTISSHLLSLKPNMTYDFSRTPRSLTEILRWKATEYRLFLLYTGPVVLKNILSDVCYSHFICLHTCFRILLTPNVDIKLINFTERLLTYFVDKFGEIYGKQFMSHNIHGLLHIVDDYRKYGSLDNCSCFPFENYLKSLKKMVRKFEKPLEQVVNRYEEFLTFTEPKISSLNKEIVFKKPHNDGPLVEHCSGPQFKIMIMNNFKININSSSNCYIGFKCREKLNICKVENISSKSSKNVLIVKCFNTIDSFFVKPINSLTLGIAVVSNLSNIYMTINIQEIKLNKYMILNDSNNVKIAIPILHSNNEFIDFV